MALGRAGCSRTAHPRDASGTSARLSWRETSPSSSLICAVFDVVAFPFDVPVDELRRRRSLKWTKYPIDVLPLPVAEMDVRLAPAIAEALHAAIDRSDTGYAGDTGAMIEALGAFCSDRWSWEIDPSHTVVCSDIGVGVVEVLRRLLPPGSRVVICPPVYPPFYQWLEDAAVIPDLVPLLPPEIGSRLDLAGIEKALESGAQAVILCHPNNPTGRIHEPDELRRLAHAAEKAGAVVLSDEIHAPLCLPGHTFSPFLSVSPAAAITGITLTSTSKGWNVPGLKCAQIIAGSENHARMLRSMAHKLQGGTGNLGLVAAETAYGRSGGWLDEVVQALVTNLTLLGELLTAHLPAVKWTPPQSSYVAWLDMRALQLGDDPAEALIRRTGVALRSGPEFGDPGRGHARLNFACSPQMLISAVEQLGGLHPHGIEGSAY